MTKLNNVSTYKQNVQEDDYMKNEKKEKKITGILTIVIVEYIGNFPRRIGGGNGSRHAAESPAPKPAT